MKRKAKQMNFEGDEADKKKRTKQVSDITPIKKHVPLIDSQEEVKVLEDFDSSKAAKIWSWNVNGIRATISKNILQNFIKDKDPDILCISETKIDEIALEKAKLKNYIPKSYLQYWNCVKPPKKGYAGTAIFTKIKPLNVIYDLGVSEHDREGRTITLEFETFYLITSYVPNAGQNLERLSYRVEEWDTAFRTFLRDLELKGKPIVL